MCHKICELSEGVWVVERQLLEVHKYVCHKICELSEGVWVVERQLLEVHKYVYKYPR